MTSTAPHPDETAELTTKSLAQRLVDANDALEEARAGLPELEELVRTADATVATLEATRDPSSLDRLAAARTRADAARSMRDSQQQAVTAAENLAGRLEQQLDKAGRQDAHRKAAERYKAAQHERQAKVDALWEQARTSLEVVVEQEHAVSDAWRDLTAAAKAVGAAAPGDPGLNLHSERVEFVNSSGTFRGYRIRHAGYELQAPKSYRPGTLTLRKPRE